MTTQSAKSNATHTPQAREWTAKELHVNSNSDGFAIMQRTAHGLHRVDDRKGAFTESDARLIASAPCLLRVARLALQVIELHRAGLMDEAVLAQAESEARAAIAKATQA